MNAVDIIAKKRDGGELSRDEIQFMIGGMLSGAVADYQMAAWAMAVLLRGMTDRETHDLTMVMVDSGEVLDLSGLAPIVVDKHSTGGVGDKTTLVVAPLVAAAGLPVAKMSGRGLGYSGGTLDKLEAIPGYDVNLDRERFLACVREHGIVVSGQTADLAPADKHLYALRDVTATVPSIPLIASSIMSKKLASGADALVLDVKVGRGAFMETLEEARSLAKLMVRIGEEAGKRVTAILSDMSQPLGHAVGNALETREAIATLRGKGPEDFAHHCAVVAGEMLYLGEKVPTPESGIDEARDMLADGSALAKFTEWVAAQGGDARVVDDPDLMPRAPIVRTVAAPEEGHLSRLDAREIGLTAVELGAGRRKKGDAIDLAVGIVVHKKVGDQVGKGAPLLDIHAQSDAAAEEAAKRLLGAVTITSVGQLASPLVLDLIRGD
ncbi:MAG: thymidine phosphorylase [Anaerolineae bacterium]